MKYGPRIIQEISDEIQKVPNIRYVCKKVGIDHSTFYRWMTKHDSFFREVQAALFMGRMHMNDSAEAVIIRGVQNNDFKSATYWLSHNSDRYVSTERVKYHQYLQKQEARTIEETDDTVFEKLFDYYSLLEIRFKKTKGKAREYFHPLIELTCNADPELVDIFYAAYAEWKLNKEELFKKRNNVEDGSESIYDK